MQRKNSEFIKSVERKEFILNIMTDRNRFKKKKMKDYNGI